MLPFLEARGSSWKALRAAGVWLRIAVLLAAGFVAAVERFREGGHKGVSVRLRDGSSVRLRYVELEEPIRRLVLKSLGSAPPPEG